MPCSNLFEKQQNNNPKYLEYSSCLTQICLKNSNKNNHKLCSTGGPYGLFAGRDASRALATFSMSEEVFRNEYDDLSDLSSMQMESVREWEMQFTGLYHLFLYNVYIHK